MRIVIIGGGIAGLAAAWFAVKKAAQVTVLEAGPRWGGKIATERVDFERGRFVIEAGADSFLASKPQAIALCRELGLAERLHTTIPSKRSTYILHDDRLLPLPGGLSMFIPTDPGSILSSRLLSWRQKARLGLDLLLPARSPGSDESLGAFVSRRLGRGAYENLVEPLIAGIYAGDGDALSLQSTFPALGELEREHGSLLRGALALRKRSSAPSQGSRSTFLTPEGGLGEMVEALAARLEACGADLRLNAPVALLNRKASSYQIELADGLTFEADAVILAAPAPGAATLLAGLDPALSAELAAIPYTSTATVSLAYRQRDLPHPLDGYGYVIPRREARRALACTWTSSKFPHRAPQGYALLRVFIGRAGDDSSLNTVGAGSSRPGPGARSPHPRAGAGTAPLQAIAQQELAVTMGITAEPLFSRVCLWDQAMPQYNLGHPERLARIDAALQKHPGLALAGAAYRGVGIPDCIRSGELAVGKVLEIRE